MVDNFWKNKRVLVTGGQGFLGKQLIRQLEEKSCNPFVPKKNDYDLCFPVHIQAMLQDAGKIDILFHLAGANYGQENAYKSFYKNITMGISLIHLSMGKVEKFVQLGTACSYSKDCSIPFKESDIWNGYPSMPYGIAKRTLLAQLQAAEQQYGLNGIYIIPSDIYGLRDSFSDNKDRIIPILIKRILAAESTVDVQNNGNSSCDFLYVEDMVRGILLAAEKYNEPEPINIGSGQAVKVAALVNIIKAIVKSEASTIWKTDKLDDWRDQLLDISRAKELLDWQPEISLYEGLKRTIKWYLEEADV